MSFSNDSLPILKTGSCLGPDLLKALKTGDEGNIKFRIVRALQQDGSGSNTTFCHLTEQFRLRNGYLPFPVDQLPCKDCHNYG